MGEKAEGAKSREEPEQQEGEGMPATIEEAGGASAPVVAGTSVEALMARKHGSEGRPTVTNTEEGAWPWGPRGKAAPPGPLLFICW